MRKLPPAVSSDVPGEPISTPLDFGPLANVPGWLHAHVDEIGSTNTALAAHVRETGASGLWLTADRQTAGKGRRGRVWIAPEGNLNASAAFSIDAADDIVALCPFVMALAVHEALCALTDASEHGRISLKWPNDVLIDGAKCAGLLLERQGRAIVAGFGINVEAAPSHVAYRATTVRTLEPTITAQTLFGALASAVDRHWRTLGRKTAARDVIAHWRKHAHAMGTVATIRLADRTLEGRLIDIDDNGLLLVERTDGIKERIAAGDVFFPANEEKQAAAPI